MANKNQNAEKSGFMNKTGELLTDENLFSFMRKHMRFIDRFDGEKLEALCFRR